MIFIEVFKIRGRLPALETGNLSPFYQYPKTAQPDYNDCCLANPNHLNSVKRSSYVKPSGLD